VTLFGLRRLDQRRTERKPEGPGSTARGERRDEMTTVKFSVRSARYLWTSLVTVAFGLRASTIFTN
jgi:hypothetical protein